MQSFCEVKIEVIQRAAINVVPNVEKIRAELKEVYIKDYMGPTKHWFPLFSDKTMSRKKAEKLFTKRVVDPWRAENYVKSIGQDSIDRLNILVNMAKVCPKDTMLLCDHDAILVKINS